jgi:hypothetical protein
MKKWMLLALVVIQLCFVGCETTKTIPTLTESAGLPIAKSATPATATNPMVTMTVTPFTSPSPSPTPSRWAVIAEIVDIIEYRVMESVEFSPALPGLNIPVGGQIRSGDGSKARLDIQPEGTIIRVGPNSRFTLESLTDDQSSPLTALTLWLGKVWIILSGGQLDVETSSGNASVRGSYMSVSYNPEGGKLIVTCLEGNCLLSNLLGEAVLTGGQASEIPGGGFPPLEPRLLTEAELQEWSNYNPEALLIVERLLNLLPGKVPTSIPFPTP